MKFGKALREGQLPEWAIYYVDYKTLKNIINCVLNENLNVAAFFLALENDKSKVSRFYCDREKWCIDFMCKMEDQVERLRQECNGTDSERSSSDDDSYFSDKEKDHMEIYMYAKKSLVGFGKELEIFERFLELQNIGFRKIVKKLLKKMNLSVQLCSERYGVDLSPFLAGTLFSYERIVAWKRTTIEMLSEVQSLQPYRSQRWNERKVYTIGCFDLFHRGHENILEALREFGSYIVVGIHDDHSYYLLKQKHPIDTLSARMARVKPFADMIFVIPSTDPTPYIEAMVSYQDVVNGRCCYVRGDDMIAFPGRKYVESVMPVHMLPRSECVSSTLIRALYHSGKETAENAAFAPTDFTGKPILHRITME